MEPRRELAHVRGSILRKSTGQSPAADFALLMMARGGRDLAANSCKAAAGEDIPIAPVVTQPTAAKQLLARTSQSSYMSIILDFVLFFKKQFIPH